MKKLLLLSLLCLPLLSMNVDVPNKIVYICTGAKAKVYHSTKKCKVLTKCTGKVRAVSFEKIQKTGKACQMCNKSELK